MGLRKWFWRWFSARWISKIEAKADREEAVAKAVTQYRNQVESVLRMECDGLRRRVAVLERRPEPADLVSHLERVLKGHGLVACQLEAAIGKVRGLHGPSDGPARASGVTVEEDVHGYCHLQSPPQASVQPP